jgi:hypothetical protein
MQLDTLELWNRKLMSRVRSSKYRQTLFFNKNFRKNQMCFSYKKWRKKTEEVLNTVLKYEDSKHL